MSSIEESIPKISKQDKNHIRRLVFNQPDVMVDIFEALTNLLIAREILDPKDVETVIIAGIQEWGGLTNHRQPTTEEKAEELKET